jgi:putative membrane protein
MKNISLIGCTGVFFIIWTDSFIGTTDRANWFIENAMTLLGLIFIIGTYRKYQFSDLSYILLCVFLCLHVYGSKYTYSENPLGFWLRDILHMSRNHYDRIVHFGCGFLLAYPFRELFINWLKFPRWIGWPLPVIITLAMGAMYELIEWSVADLFFKAQGPAYLGTQGDVWDAQKDLIMAFSGAILATTIISLIEKISSYRASHVNAS